MQDGTGTGDFMQRRTLLAGLSAAGIAAPLLASASSPRMVMDGFPAPAPLPFAQSQAGELNELPSRNSGEPRPSLETKFEVAIIGGGPAGLSAALVLGRARRRAIIIDGGPPRNAAAPAMHSFLSRDGILPVDFRAICHDELARYPTITRHDGFVSNVRGTHQGFEIAVGDVTVTCRKVIIAIGLVDTLPNIEGLAANWGKGVHACPYCDGYEHRDKHWGILANQPEMLDHALFLRGWTDHMTVFTAVEDVLAEKHDALQSAGIRLIHATVSKVVGGDGHSLRGVELTDGSVHQVESLWLRPVQSQTPLVERLGLRLRGDGAIWRNELGETSVPGILAAGDCAAGPVQQAILAAADGARLAFLTSHFLVMAGR